MILSHKHRFIFLKTSKTAGSSIEIALSKLCGPNDIITPMTPPDEALRRENGGMAPRNFRRLSRSFRARHIFRYIARRRLPALFYSHMAASEIQRRVDPAVWTNYNKFCFERNPWDRVVSYYHWLYRKGTPPEFSRYLDQESNLLSLKEKGWNVYTVDGSVAVDRVCSYENLMEELRAECERVGMTPPDEIPRAKGGFRSEKKPYRDYYTDEEAKRVGEMFADEIQLMDYEF